MTIPPGTAQRLRERQHAVKTLCLLATWGPPIFSVLLFVTVSMAVIDFVRGGYDEAAIVMSLMLVPGTCFAWLLRSLVNDVVGNLDLMTDPAGESDPSTEE